MLLSSAPAKIVLPFANSGGKNVIPVPSQIGVTPGAASFTDGFPPLTRTPIASGGIPPSGLDMNGVIFDVSAITRWANAGAGYVFDGTFAADTNVGGYPKGARILRTDGNGYWLNTTDNNTTDPETSGAAAAGWVPDFTNGVTAVTMTNANVTLTALQYGKPIVVITGLLTTNLNLIFPPIAGQWTVINSTTGAFAITAKTPSGSGVVVEEIQNIVGDGTNIYEVGANFGSQGLITEITSTGNFTTPSTSSITTIYRLRAIGGGGGGGGANGSLASSAGGGAGAYIEHTFTGIAPSTAIAITIGAAGAAGSTSGGTGGAGGNTVVGSPVSLTAGGGAGGTGNSATTSTFSQGGAGGTVTGSPNVQSVAGAAGFCGYSLNAQGAFPGNGASSRMGNGGLAAINITGIGTTVSVFPSGYGAGGQGAELTTAGGGTGVQGIVIIEQLTP